MRNYTELIPAPAPISVNGNLNPCPTQALIHQFGAPREARTVSDVCKPPTSKFWRDRMITESVGPFRMTGHREFVWTLALAFKDVEAKDPDLYRILGSAGGLCVRWVRGTTGVWSNHSLGLAIDITLGGRLDRRGDNLVQQGLLDLYAILKGHDIFWGVEFRIEDAMHFEASRELVNHWIRENRF